MPKRITTWMAIVAALALGLGGFVSTGRWYYALSEPEQKAFNFARGLGFVFVAVVLAILLPIYLFDRAETARRRKEEALATKYAELDAAQSRS